MRSLRHLLLANSHFATRFAAFSSSRIVSARAAQLSSNLARTSITPRTNSSFLIPHTSTNTTALSVKFSFIPSLSKRNFSTIPSKPLGSQSDDKKSEQKGYTWQEQIKSANEIANLVGKLFAVGTVLVGGLKLKEIKNMLNNYRIYGLQEIIPWGKRSRLMSAEHLQEAKNEIFLMARYSAFTKDTDKEVLETIKAKAKRGVQIKILIWNPELFDQNDVNRRREIVESIEDIANFNLANPSTQITLKILRVKPYFGLVLTDGNIDVAPDNYKYQTNAKLIIFPKLLYDNPEKESNQTIVSIFKDVNELSFSNSVIPFRIYRNVVHDAWKAAIPLDQFLQQTQNIQTPSIAPQRRAP